MIAPLVPCATAQRKAKARHGTGFTLVEMIVSVGLFAIVMLVCVATLLALVAANRKAQALQTVMNNLEITLDSMARSIRVGSAYYCYAGGLVPATPAPPVQDCLSGNTSFAFEHYGGTFSDNTDQWTYSYDPVQKAIFRSTHGGSNLQRLTGPEISIDNMKFYVMGTTRADATQPRVIIVVNGSIITKSLVTKTSFHLQVTAEQRVLDL